MHSLKVTEGGRPVVSLLVPVSPLAVAPATQCWSPSSSGGWVVDAMDTNVERKL